LKIEKIWNGKKNHEKNPNLLKNGLKTLNQWANETWVAT